MVHRYYVLLLISVIIFIIPVVYATQYYNERILTTDTAPQVIINGSKNNGGGAVLAFWGDGSTTPNKYIRTNNGEMDILNNSYQVMAKIKDNGNMYTTSVVQANAVSNNTDTVSTKSLTLVSSGFGQEIYGKYLDPVYGSGVDTTGIVYASNNITGSGFKVCLYRSYVGIPQNNQSPYPGDYQLRCSPTMTQFNSNPIGIYLQYADLGSNTGNQYYYFAYQAIKSGTVTITSEGNNIMGGIR